MRRGKQSSNDEQSSAIEMTRVPTPNVERGWLEIANERTGTRSRSSSIDSNGSAGPLLGEEQSTQAHVTFAPTAQIMSTQSAPSGSQSVPPRSTQLHYVLPQRGLSSLTPTSGFASTQSAPGPGLWTPSAGITSTQSAPGPRFRTSSSGMTSSQSAPGPSLWTPSNGITSIQSAPAPLRSDSATFSSSLAPSRPLQLRALGFNVGDPSDSTARSSSSAPSRQRQMRSLGFSVGDPFHGSSSSTRPSASTMDDVPVFPTTSSPSQRVSYAPSTQTPAHNPFTGSTHSFSQSPAPAVVGTPSPFPPRLSRPSTSPYAQSPAPVGMGTQSPFPPSATRPATSPYTQSPAPVGMGTPSPFPVSAGRPGTYPQSAPSTTLPTTSPSPYPHSAPQSAPPLAWTNPSPSPYPYPQSAPHTQPSVSQSPYSQPPPMQGTQTPYPSQKLSNSSPSPYPVPITGPPPPGQWGDWRMYTPMYQQQPPQPLPASETQPLYQNAGSSARPQSVSSTPVRVDAPPATKPNTQGEESDSAAPSASDRPTSSRPLSEGAPWPGEWVPSGVILGDTVAGAPLSAIPEDVTGTPAPSGHTFEDEMGQHSSAPTPHNAENEAIGRPPPPPPLPAHSWIPTQDVKRPVSPPNQHYTQPTFASNDQYQTPTWYSHNGSQYYLPPYPVSQTPYSSQTPYPVPQYSYPQSQTPYPYQAAPMYTPWSPPQNEPVMSYVPPDELQIPYDLSDPQTYPLEDPLAPQEYIHIEEVVHHPLRTFCFETIPRQVYLYFLLGLPALYFSRVTRIFKEADMSMPEIKKMALELPAQGTTKGKDQNLGFLTPSSYEPATVPAPYENLKYTWESFIDSLMREWKTFNIISVLLLSAILTILQIQSAASDPLTRFSALLSLICALISLLYGCMYIIRFGSMRKTHKAAEWAFEAQKTKTSIFWNVWVLLAMPLIWLAWSILLYMICILSFVWRTGTTADDQSTPIVTSHDILGPRIAITAIFGLGLTYFIFIFSTFRRYGDAMDEAWNTRVKNWLMEKAVAQVNQLPQLYQPTEYSSEPAPFSQQQQQQQQPIIRPPQPFEPTYQPPQQRPTHAPHSSYIQNLPQPSSPSAPSLYPASDTTAPVDYLGTGKLYTDQTVRLTTKTTPTPTPELDLPVPPPAPGPSSRIYIPLNSVKVLDKRLMQGTSKALERILLLRSVPADTWSEFIEEVKIVWSKSREDDDNRPKGQPVPYPPPDPLADEKMQEVLRLWNERTFHSREIQLLFCREHSTDVAAPPVSAIHLFSFPVHSYEPEQKLELVQHGLDSIEIHDPNIPDPVTIKL